MPHLRRVDCSAPGIRRVRRGQGFAYIDPRVFDRFESGETIRPSLRRIVADREPGDFPDRERIERAVLRLLAD